MHTALITALAAGAAIFALSAADGANAQSVFGDTKLSYQNGIVYDDDLVPGRGPNQPFLVGEQDTVFSSSGNGAAFSSSGRVVRAPSRNLIGSDGRAINAVRQDRRRATAVNDIINSREF